MKKSMICIVILLFTAMMANAASQPIDAVQKPIEEGIALLKDPQYHDQAKKEIQREKMWDIIQLVFDFTEVSARALASNWRNFSPQERKEFTEVFTELLKNTYLDKLQGAFHNEQVVFLGQEMVSDDKAVVKTKVLREQVEVPMDYSLRKQNDDWKVYDVNIEGISLVKNYRTQFKDILSKDKPAQLIERLKEKNIQMNKSRTTKKQ